MTETKTRQMKPSGVPWLGDIPAGWDVGLLNALYSLRNEKVSDKDYPPLSVSMGGIVPQLDSVAKTDDGDNRKLVKKGDFVINSRSDRRGACGIAPQDGSVSLINIVLIPHKDMYAGFYNWLFRSSLFSDEFYKWGHGIVDDLWTTRWSEMKKIAIPLPPLPEQRAIADFLDEKCAAIDAIVEEAKSGIEEYAKWKQSVVFQAVTKGLDPHAKMKDSGVEWIGEIPEEWKVTPLRFLTDSYKAGPFGSALITDQLQKTGTILVYTPEHIAKREAELPNNLYLPEERREEMSQFFVKAGDVVFPIVGSLGRALQVTTSMPEGIINQRLAKFRLRPDRIDANYFMWLFAKSEFFKQHIEVVCRGSIIVNLTKGIVGDMPIPLPTLPEQRAIAAYLDEKCSAIDALIEEKKQLIEDLGVYKKSLIYETVTGKRKIA